MSELLKIEFGCNGRKMEGWLCTDKDECDITKPLPWPDNSAQMCYASHVIEHVTSGECMRFLKEVYRILAPGGLVRLVVPCIGTHMSRLHIQDLCEGHGHFQVFSVSSLRAMLFGAGFDDGRIAQGVRTDLDVHWKEIGDEKDRLESLYVSAIK